MSITSPQRLDLPLEIWIIIIDHVTKAEGHPGPWLSCRLVSRTFKAATELTFRSKVHAWRLHACMPSGIYPKQTGHFRCSRISSDGSRAYFIEKEGPKNNYGRHLTDQSRVALFWDDNINTFQVSSVCYWRWRYGGNRMYSVGILRNEYKLPGLQIHSHDQIQGHEYKAQEISFLWKPLMSRFFGEEEYIRKDMMQKIPGRWCAAEAGITRVYRRGEQDVAVKRHDVAEEEETILGGKNLDCTWIIDRTN
ncbi:hypothetical protein F5Y15DRAFT_310105 [Xylariaceae sp. FL0016]|nr:hypothetical protein F5Y15DRAFT_310105 [Xylariaceae sp. FL0016]